MSMLDFLTDMGAAWRNMAPTRRDRTEARERAAIAKAFNDRYTYRRNYRFGGRLDQHAWMCPECNDIHAAVEFSVWTGVQYPACCHQPAGHRLGADIKTK